MKQQSFWGIVIPILIALSIWVMVGTHYDSTKHAHVPNFPAKYGLDIRGGVRIVLRAELENLKGAKYDPGAVQRILENRINGSGVGEATVQQKGADQFIIEIPDVQASDPMVAGLGRMAQMTMYYMPLVANDDSSAPANVQNRPVHMNLITDPVTGEKSTSFTDQRTRQTFRDGSHIRQDYANIIESAGVQKPGTSLYMVPAPLGDGTAASGYYLTPSQIAQIVPLNQELTNWQQFLASCQVVMTGTDMLPSSQAEIDQTSKPAVTQDFTPSGSKKMEDFTTAHMNEIMGIVLDDRVLSAAQIIGVISDHGQISGGFATLKEAQGLATILNAGALPVPLEQVQVESVEASLGAGAVHKSLIAGIYGLIFVILFMLIYYRLPGLVANVALCIYALFTMAIYRGAFEWLFPGFAVTLTLPGIAGFILSIGMAVDANILIFERLKEELNSGKSLKSAIDAGFKRAFTAIRDSNICTVITSVVLYSLGTPSVKGFAITLLIGVLVSLFSAITVTRTLLYGLVNAGIGVNPQLFGLGVKSAALTHTDRKTGAEEGGWNIIGKRKIFYGLSLLIIIPGLIFWLGLHGLKKSIEFDGGTQIEVSYGKTVTQDAIYSALNAAGYKDSIVQLANGGTMAIVSTSQTSPVQDPNHNPVYQGVMTALNTVGTATEQSFSVVKGVISAELTTKAVEAVLIASGLIVLYLAFSFSIGGFMTGLRFGFSAIVALLHDVLVLIGVFAILGHFLGWKIDSLFVTALLTVIGFSVHDTVVIFDRVRENLVRRRNDDFETLVNTSIQQSLARSINTSLTVLMTLAALIVFGGESTLLLDVALFIGILSGTYSSIFNASAILVDWENWLAGRAANNTPRSSTPPSVSNGSSAAAITSNAPEPRASDSFSRPETTSSDTPANRAKRKRPVRRF